MTETKARIWRAIRALDYDFRQFTVDDFITHLEKRRKREIILESFPMSHGLHGIWARAETADYIFFDRLAHPVHQVHHILHETGHIVLGHQPHKLADVLPPELLALLAELLAQPPLGHCRMWQPEEKPTSTKLNNSCACCNMTSRLRDAWQR